eukprot:4889053-Alexandrium_andersonii.AAC.1
MRAQRANEPKCLVTGRARWTCRTNVRQLGPTQVAKGPHGGSRDGGEARDSGGLRTSRSPSQ